MAEKKTVLITGGGRGIGAACVRLFAAQGDSVAFLYRSDDESAGKLARECGALPIRADVSDAKQVEMAVRAAVRRLGEIDVLICNAGVASFSLLQQTSDEEWRRVMGTNLDGTFFAVRAVLPSMIARGSGRIVTLSSIWGQVGSSMEVAYSASKAALIGFTRALSKEVGPGGITVNCIAPGVIDTDMNASLSETVRAELCDQTPLGRMGTAEEVAEAALFLASDAASFITGQVLGVDGGFL